MSVSTKNFLITLVIPGLILIACVSPKAIITVAQAGQNLGYTTTSTVK